MKFVVMELPNGLQKLKRDPKVVAAVKELVAAIESPGPDVIALPSGVDEQRDAEMIQALKVFKTAYVKYMGRKVTFAFELV